MNGDWMSLSMAELSTALREKRVTSVELVGSALEAIKRSSELNAFVTLDETRALERAAAADARGQRLSPLDGIPFAAKDNIVTQGLRTTAGSQILGDFIPPYSATVIEKLEAAGAVLIGKTNLDEFGMGSSTERSRFGATKNPWNTNRVAGGSSGGSAAAVAARLVPFALGSDTGGSIRQPASMCGVLGLKPTYGRVSRFGLIAYASSLDQIGPMARTTDDLACVLDVIAGHDPKESTTLDVPHRGDWDRNLEGKIVGLPTEFFGDGLDPEVRSLVMEAAAALEAKGAKTVHVSLPNSSHAIAAYYLIATAEASSNLSRFDGIRYGARVAGKDYAETVARTRHEGFGPEVKRRIALGTFVLSAGYYDAYYAKAQKVRTLIRADYEAAFRTCDLLLTPVAPTPAFGLGEKLTDPLSMYLADVMTIGVNLAGVPAISVPAGFSSDALPVGAQLIAPWFEERRLISGAHAIESLGAAARAPSTRLFTR